MIESMLWAASYGLRSGFLQEKLAIGVGITRHSI